MSATGENSALPIQRGEDRHHLRDGDDAGYQQNKPRLPRSTPGNSTIGFVDSPIRLGSVPFLAHRRRAGGVST